MNSNTIFTLVESDLFVLKMVGELRFSFAPSLMEALKTISEDKCIKHVIIDLSQARFLDSTIMGTLLNYFLKEEIWSRFASNPPRIVTKNPDIIKSLVSIGMDMFFPINETEPKMKNLKNNYIEAKTMLEDKQTLEQYVKASHRTLSKLNPRSDFQDIVSQIKH